MVNIPLFTRFFTSQVVQDFFHQQEGCEFVDVFMPPAARLEIAEFPPALFCDEGCADKVFRHKTYLIDLLPQLWRISPPKNKKVKRSASARTVEHIQESNAVWVAAANVITEQ